jgi:tRNA (guanine-N(7)-)-methyltransferase
VTGDEPERDGKAPDADQAGPDGPTPGREPGREPPAGSMAPKDVTALLAGSDAPLEVEIGMGGGHFLVEYARRHPAHLFVGIERKRHRVVRALKKAQTSGLSNVHVVMGNADALLDVLAPSSVSAFHIYFLDPWPKDRHRRRRFLRSETVRLLVDRLQPGGRLLLATDMLDYFIQAKILFVLHGAVWSASEPPEETHLSVYSTRFREAGTPTYFAVARKPTGSGSEAAGQGTD